MKSVGGVRKAIHQSSLAKGLGLGLQCWGFKGVQEEILSEEANTHQIGSLAFPLGLYTSPQIHPCHRLFDTDGYQESSSPSLLSRTCSWDFWLFLSSEPVVMRQSRRWKWLWRMSLIRSHKRTSMVPCRSCWNGTTGALQSEEFTSKGTRGSCVYYQ